MALKRKKKKKDNDFPIAGPKFVSIYKSRQDSFLPTLTNSVFWTFKSLRGEKSKDILFYYFGGGGIHAEGRQAEVPEPGIESAPQQRLEPQTRLDLMRLKRTPKANSIDISWLMR